MSTTCHRCVHGCTRTLPHMPARPAGVGASWIHARAPCPSHPPTTPPPSLRRTPQIQGQLQMLDRPWCHFFYWLPSGCMLATVQRDRQYWAMCWQVRLRLRVLCWQG